MNAKELLASLQIAGRTYYSNKGFLNETRNSIISEMFEGMVKRIEDCNKRMPTDFQDSHFYYLIEDSFAALERTITENEIKFKGNPICSEQIPLFGTADLEGYNAFVGVEGEAKVIVFNNDLLKFTERMIELYAKEQWLLSKGLMNKHIKKILAQNFTDVMFCYHVFSDAYAAIPLAWCEVSDLHDLENPNVLYELTSSIDELMDLDQYLLFEDQIRLSVYQWIAAHEYAHIVLGHLNGKTKLSKRNLCGLDVTEINFSYQKEFDADLLGTIITMSSNDLILPSNGICLAMNCMLLSQFFNISERSFSHPPMEDRIEKVYSYIKNNGEILVSRYKHAFYILKSNVGIFYAVFSKIRDEKILFSSLFEMQKFIYKDCDVFDNLFL